MIIKIITDEAKMDHNDLITMQAGSSWDKILVRTKSIHVIYK